MFVRFRTKLRRVQVSILEARRVAGKVTNEHIASLGSIAVPMTVAGRQAFWANLWDRLSTLSNRIGANDQAKIRNAVHARIPMVMPDEANIDEANYWAEYSAVWAGFAASERESAVEVAARCNKEAEIDERVAAAFAENRAAALRGERPMDRSIIGELFGARLRAKGYQLAHPPKPNGSPCIMANGEAGVVRHPKRLNRIDRRRRRNGLRFTPKPAEAQEISEASEAGLDKRSAELIAAMGNDRLDEAAE